MPRYDYQCDACGEAFEATQKMSDPPLDTCTLCGEQGSVKKLLSGGTGLIFKGSGFYITDYKNSNSGGGESSSKSSSESKSASTAENGSTSTSTATADSSSSSKTTAKSEATSKSSES